MQKLTAKQVVSKYKWKYIDVYKCPDWDTSKKWETLYEVRKSYKEVHENTTFVKDENFYNNF